MISRCSVCVCVFVHLSLSLLGNGWVNIPLSLLAKGYVFYAVRVVPYKSRRLVLFYEYISLSPTRSSFPVIFLGPRANDKLVPKFPSQNFSFRRYITIKISGPCTKWH
jgi:hypothetical protein